MTNQQQQQHLQALLATIHKIAIEDVWIFNWWQAILSKFLLIHHTVCLQSKYPPYERWPTDHRACHANRPRRLSASKHLWMPDSCWANVSAAMLTPSELHPHTWLEDHTESERSQHKSWLSKIVKNCTLTSPTLRLRNKSINICTCCRPSGNSSIGPLIVSALTSSESDSATNLSSATIITKFHKHYWNQHTSIDSLSEKALQFWIKKRHLLGVDSRETAVPACCTAVGICVKSALKKL